MVGLVHGLEHQCRKYSDKIPFETKKTLVVTVVEWTGPWEFWQDKPFVAL